MKKQNIYFRLITIMLAFLYIISIPVYGYEYKPKGVKLNRDHLKSIRKKKEKGEYKKKEMPKIEFEVEKSTFAYVEDIDFDKGIAFKLPHESRLSISGRKLIGVKYGIVKYADEEESEDKGTPADATDGFDMTQELQVRIKGKVGRKIDVNVDYDDTVRDKRDIAVVYTGYKKGDIMDDKGTVCEEDEIVQEVAFGDINLSLPSTEFISYNKNLFGLRLKAKYNNFHLMGIGSRTKGITETKRFTGNTTFDKKDLRDTAFTKMRYYRLNFGSNSIAISPETEVIYLNDQTSSETGASGLPKETVYYEEYGNTDSAKIASGKFEKLRRGTDYTIDYSQGVITFKRTINSNYIIAVDYTIKNGSNVSRVSGGNRVYPLIKDATNTVNVSGKQEIKKYYSLGSTKIIRGTFGKDFIARVLDADRKEAAEFSNIYDKIEVDFDKGILKFKEDKPFDSLNPKIYTDNNATSEYIIYVEYYHRVKTYMLRPNIVVDSERILINDAILVKNKDYIIDYDTGFITFFNDEVIDRETIIEVTYEYMPFGGQYQQTLVGLRTEYKVEDKGHLGATVIYSGADRTSRIPNIRSTPASVTVIDSDMGLDIQPEGFPVKTTIRGEIAQSRRNPNVFGKAIVENMEGIKIEDTAPSDKDMWQVASNPNGVPFYAMTLLNEDVKLKDINATIKETETDNSTVQVLDLRYEKLSMGKQTSIVYPISTAGMDYSKKEYLEFWMYSDANTSQYKPKITIKYGEINEDADGRDGFEEDADAWKSGQPKTEDLNNDGSLNRGEDIGWTYKFKNEYGVEVSSAIGYNNGKIDTEDLDGDGNLDKDEVGTEYTTLKDSDGNDYDYSTGWKKIIIPLEIDSTNEDAWKFVKQVRITIENDSYAGVAQGSIKLYNFSLVNYKWEKGEVSTAGGGAFNISAVNNEDNPKYASILEENWELSEYENLYSGILLDDNFEQALLLEYDDLDPGVEGSTEYVYSRALDFSQYRKFNFFLYPESNNATFFIQCGADDSNYFEYQSKLDSVGQWQLHQIDLFTDSDRDGVPDGFTGKVGNPRLSNIKKIRMGVRNTNGSAGGTVAGTVLVNELYVTDVIKKDGLAYRTELGFATPGWFNTSGYYKSIDKDFETITSGSTQDGVVGTTSITSGKDIESFGGKFGFERIRFMPVDVNVARTITDTPDTYDTSGSVREEGRVDQRSGSISSSLKIKYLPTVTGSAGRSITDSEYLDEKDDTHTYSGSVGYSLPFTLFVLPKNYSGSYKRINAYSNYNIHSGAAKEIGREDALEITDDYSAKTNYSILRRITISPSYSLRQVKERKMLLFDLEGQENWYKKSNDQSAKVSAAISLLNWLKPSVSYNINNTEDYNLAVSSATGYTDVVTKDVSRTSDGQASVSMGVRNIVPWFSPFSTLNVNGSFRVEDGDSWEDVDARIDTLDKLVIRDVGWVDVENFEDGQLGDLALRKSLTNKDTLKLSSRWKPLSFIRLRGLLSLVPTLTTTVTYTDIDEYKDITGTQSQSLTKIWPDVFASVNKIEHLFFISRYMKDSDLSGRYKEKTTESIQISETFAIAKSGTYRYKLFNKYDFSWSYGREDFEEFNFASSTSTTTGTLIDTANQDMEKKLTRMGYSNSWSGQVGMQFGVWRITPKYANSRSMEWNVIDDQLTSMSLLDTYSIQSRADFSLPVTWRIPFIGTLVAFSNRLVLDTELRYETKRSDLNVETDNTNTYLFKLSGDYDVSNNLKVTIGSGFSKVDYLERPENNYYSFEINAQMSIVF